jgi:hypothetical protein
MNERRIVEESTAAGSALNPALKQRRIAQSRSSAARDLHLAPQGTPSHRLNWFVIAVISASIVTYS